MASVVEAMKPLVGGVSSSSDQQLENKLSPGTESSLRLLLTLTLEMGVEVRRSCNFCGGLVRCDH